MKKVLIIVKKVIKKILEIIVWVWFSIPFFACRAMTENVIYSVILPIICKSVETGSKYFCTYNLRPKWAGDIVSVEKTSINAEKFAIIMQGTLVTDNNFTLETVKLYGRIYPGVLVVVSTWENEDKDYIEQIKLEKNCIVILNSYPNYSGFCNLNFQTKTTVSGLKSAEKAGKEFVFKTRCDYRFYKRGLLEYMYDLIMKYPCCHDELGQNHRIIMTSGRNDDMYRPYFVGDQFNFGWIKDMLNLWDAEMIQENFKFSDFCINRKIEHYSWKKERTYTSELTKRYVLKMTGRQLPITVKDYWDYVKKYLIFLSAKDVDAYWCKYEQRYEETAGNGEFYRIDSEKTCFSYNWNFINWHNLYTGNLSYDKSMEEISESNYF